ncbi:MAG: hypothetical protein BMS9Abin13_477 [Patescibacteria group bacterium]|nr:MAG: hypothetical protein BMS9Abin13_477 [Patescibacteria group bacterium]
MEHNETIVWSAPEYEYKEKSADWYWALSIIALSLTVAVFILGNMLFAVFILISAFTLALYGARKPHILEVKINKRGIRVNNTLYPYTTLKSFWIDDEGEKSQIIIQSEKPLMPYIIVPLGDVSADMVRDTLLEFLEEEEHVEPLSQKLMEYLGF